MKKITRRSFLMAAAAAGIAASFTACDDTAGSQAAVGEDGTWSPDHDITIRIPAAAGGAFDLAARIFADSVQESFGETVMVTNITGANGGTAAADLNGYDPDPCELMGGNIGMFTMVPLFNPDMALKLDDFEIVTSLLSDEYVLCTCPDKTGIEDFAGLLEYAKSNKVLVGTKAPGETDHALITAMFHDAAIDYDIVTSDGANKLLISTIAGDNTCSVCPASVALQFVQEGTAKPILCFSAETCTYYEGMEVPTAQSLGYDYVFRTNNFIMARKGADPAALKAMYDAYAAVQGTEEFEAKAAEANFIPYTNDGPTTLAEIAAAAELFKNIYETYYA